MEKLPLPIAIICFMLTIFMGIGWSAAEAGYLTVGTNLFEPLTYTFGAITGLMGFLAAYLRHDEDDVPQKTNRDLLIDTVRNNWIEGVLHDALRDAQIQVEIAAAPDQAGDSSRFVKYDLPIETVLKREGHIEPFERSPALLYQTFTYTDGKLLILGAPGSGKTVLLLQLAEKLLEQAAAVPKFSSVPVVFNLSSWAADPKQSIETWVIDELGRNYGASKKLAQEWVNGDALIYLLDGLDEVAEAYRDVCLTAVNAFMGMTRQVVVCSRIDEYEALSDKLKMTTAVQLQPLEQHEVQKTLERYIDDKKTVADMMHLLTFENAVWQKVNKPLFINVLITTYADGKPFEGSDFNTFMNETMQHIREFDNTSPDSAIREFVVGEFIQQTIIEPYIMRQLRNKSYEKASNEQINRTLAWIGHNLQQREKTVFYIEMLQRDWMPTDKQAERLSWLFVAVTGLFGGLFGGFFGGLLIGLYVRMIWGMMIGLGAGSIIGLFVGLRDIDLERTLIFDLKTMSRLTNEDIYEGIWGNLFVGLFVGVIWGLRGGLTLGLILGLTLGLILWLLGVLLVGLSDRTTLTQRSLFNQGYSDTSIAGLLVGLLLGVIWGLLIGLLFFSLLVGLLLGVIWGMFGGLSLGLGDLLKHTLLRLSLERQNLAPRRFDLFLEHVIDRRIMRRVGGSAIFIHRYILEYYADLWEREYAKEYE